jgi:hypothetical protein
MAASKSACVGAFTLWATVSAFAQTSSVSQASTPVESPSAFNVSLPDIGRAINSSCRLSVPAGADTSDRTKVAEVFVSSRLAEWQQRLNLEDWKISVVMARRSDLKPRTLGAIRWDKPKKTAVMWVLDASEHKLPMCETLANMEVTIVHELVHLELSSLPRSEASRAIEERAVGRIAQALLKLDRRELSRYNHEPDVRSSMSPEFPDAASPSLPETRNLLR